MTFSYCTNSPKIHNHCWLWTSVGQQEFNTYTVYPKHYCRPI